MERDALTELVNLGVSRAASSLRVMVGHEILLSVPAFAIVPRSRRRPDDRRSASHPNSSRCGQDFEGDFSGRALLIFPETKSLELVRAITGGGLPLEDIVALEQEALAETGNIILNNCLATIANVLRRTLAHVVAGDLSRRRQRICSDCPSRPRIRLTWCWCFISISPSMPATSPDTSPC